ncbi:MAG TPA: PIN domain-containing protein [Candidatus Angelobacter sp.]|nr:PIN domain-containing protein [Candidatus Angelobacter sp.]
MKVYFDTSVLVAASVADHPNYAQATAALHAIHAEKLEGHTSAHGLAEFYSVLTRTPFTPPIYPSEAWQLLANNILPHFEILTLSEKEYTETIKSCARQGWTGGRIYDALHLRCAQKSGCTRIYTFNVRHFQQLAPELADLISAPLPG